MTVRTLLFLASAMLLYSCTQNAPASEKSTPAPVASYEELPTGHLDSLAGLVTQIDYIFYDLPISMSTAEPSSIQALMSHYEPGSSIAMQHGCKSIGRIFYVSQGNHLLAADLYFRDTCRFAVFLKDEKPLFAARINDKGASFLLNAGVPLSPKE